MDRSLLLLLALVGCSTESGPVPMGPVHSYYPRDELVDVAPVVLDRINRATCLGLRVSDSGTPMTRGVLQDKPDTPLVDESGSCGLTTVFGYGLQTPWRLVTRTEIVIAKAMPPGCPDLETALLHEVIHDLRRELAEQPNLGHTADFGPGVFAGHVGWHPPILEADLLAICENQDCRCFNPEE